MLWPQGEILRIAVLSDIHSNDYALEAVLTDVRKRGVDITVNLGDILYGPRAITNQRLKLRQE